MGKSVIVAGIGSRKGVSKDEVLAAIDAALAAHGLGRAGLAALATTDFKRGETGIFEAAQALGLELRVIATPLPAGRDTSYAPPPSRAEDALDTSPPLRAVEDGPAAHATPLRDPAEWRGGAEPSGLAFGKPEDRLREAEGGSPVGASPAIEPHLEGQDPPHPAPASLGHPLPGGERSTAQAAHATPIRHPAQRGGGAERSEAEGGSGSTADASIPRGHLNNEASSTPTSPSNSATRGAQQPSRSSPRRGEGGRAERRPGEGECGPEPATLSQAIAGTPSVSETAALGAAGKGARLLGPRIATGRVTCALATSEPIP